MNKSLFWRFIYKVYPPCLRLLERAGIHSKRQDFILGALRGGISFQRVSDFLQQEGFEPAVLAWKDPEEVLGMRKIHNGKFQYHLRVYADREIRGHYEYSSEGNPWGHIMQKKFEPASDYFISLLKDYMDE